MRQLADVVKCGRFWRDPQQSTMLGKKTWGARSGFPVGPTFRGTPGNPD